MIATKAVTTSQRCRGVPFLCCDPSDLLPPEYVHDHLPSSPRTARVVARSTSRTQYLAHHRRFQSQRHCLSNRAVIRPETRSDLSAPSRRVIGLDPSRTVPRVLMFRRSSLEREQGRNWRGLCIHRDGRPRAVPVSGLASASHLRPPPCRLEQRDRKPALSMGGSCSR